MTPAQKQECNEKAWEWYRQAQRAKRKRILAQYFTIRAISDTTHGLFLDNFCVTVWCRPMSGRDKIAVVCETIEALEAARRLLIDKK